MIEEEEEDSEESGEQTNLVEIAPFFWNGFRAYFRKNGRTLKSESI